MVAFVCIHRRIESEKYWTAAPGLHFKAQTRLWSYDPEPLKHNQEFADIQIDSVQDQTDSAREAGPVEAQRMWERSAEDNAMDLFRRSVLSRPWATWTRFSRPW